MSSSIYEWDACATDDAYDPYYGIVKNTFLRTAGDGSNYVLAVNDDHGGAWELEGMPLYRVSRNVPCVHNLYLCAYMHSFCGEA